MTALLTLAAGLLYTVGALIGQVAAVTVALAAGLFDSPVILDTVSWGLIAGVVTPLLTSLAQQPRWTGRTRALVGAAVSIAVGFLTCLVNGDLDNGQTLLSTIAVVMVASMTTYKGLWKPTGVAPAVENATSPGSTDGGDARHAA